MASQPLQPAPDRVDQRKAQRSVTVFALGKLARDGVEHPCLIRDRSAGGVRVESSASLAVDDLVDIEMRGLDPTRAAVRWVRGDFAGLEFRPTPEQLAARNPAATPRGPRFAYRTPAVFKTEYSRFDVETCDLAIGGMKLRTSLALAPRVLGAVELDGGQLTLPCAVAWSRGQFTGVRFVTRLPLDKLFMLLRPR